MYTDTLSRYVNDDKAEVQSRGHIPLVISKVIRRIHVPFSYSGGERLPYEKLRGRIVALFDFSKRKMSPISKVKIR